MQGHRARGSKALEQEPTRVDFVDSALMSIGPLVVRRFDSYEPGVDVLAARRLMTMNGQHVARRVNRASVKPAT